jgi:hypothetical protein
MNNTSPSTSHDAVAAGTALSTLLTPLLQPDVLWTVALAALGGWWALPPAETGGSRRRAALMYLRVVATAAALCWSATWLLRQAWAVPPTVATPVVAFAIAAGGDNWRGVFRAALDSLRDLIPSALSRLTGGPSK